MSITHLTRRFSMGNLLICQFYIFSGKLVFESHSLYIIKTRVNALDVIEIQRDKVTVDENLSNLISVNSNLNIYNRITGRCLQETQGLFNPVIKVLIPSTISSQLSLLKK